MLVGLYLSTQRLIVYMRVYMKGKASGVKETRCEGVKRRDHRARVKFILLAGREGCGSVFNNAFMNITQRYIT